MQFRKHYFILSLLFSGCYFAADILFCVLSYVEYSTAWGNEVTASMLQMLTRIGYTEAYMLTIHFLYPIVIALFAVLYFLIRREFRKALPCTEFLLPVAAGVCGALGFLLPILLFGIYGCYIAWFCMGIRGLVRKEPPED